jgi:hypothetical protein
MAAKPASVHAMRVSHILNLGSSDNIRRKKARRNKACMAVLPVLIDSQCHIRVVVKTAMIAVQSEAVLSKSKS